MSSIIDLFGVFRRVYRMAVSPPPGPTKTENALKFGILGAAKIAYVLSLIQL